MKSFIGILIESIHGSKNPQCDFHQANAVSSKVHPKPGALADQ
jgi:hypothetical protein